MTTKEKTMKITISCCLCSDKFETNVAIPVGWARHYDEIDDEQGFCPKHASVAAFAESQCPGCVGGWGDCPMWSAFAYSYGRTIGQKDYDMLERGVCPRRVNGTIGLDLRAGTVEDLNLNEQATVESGVAFAQAIKDYCAKYPK